MALVIDVDEKTIQFSGNFLESGNTGHINLVKIV